MYKTVNKLNTDAQLLQADVSDSTGTLDLFFDDNDFNNKIEKHL